MTAHPIVVRVLEAGEAQLLDTAVNEVFDHPIDPRWSARFFADPRHHLAVAIDDGRVVGMISAVDYVHPDKAPQLWINELGVAPEWRRRGIATRLVETMLAHAETLECTDVWLLTERDNLPARAFYESLPTGGDGEGVVLFALKGSVTD